MAKRVRASTSNNSSKAMGSDSADRDAELHELTITPLAQDENASFGNATERAAVAARVGTRSRATGAQTQQQTGGNAAGASANGESTFCLLYCAMTEPSFM